MNSKNLKKLIMEVFKPNIEYGFKGKEIQFRRNQYSLMGITRALITKNLLDTVG